MEGEGISRLDYVNPSKRGKSRRQSGKEPERNDQDSNSDIEREGYHAASRRVLLFPVIFSDTTSTLIS
jgi:hypothetical protein